jgi:pimeloyl-[acyl-carrier protein] methyl ester esterase
MDRLLQDCWAEVLAYHGWGYGAADWQSWRLWLKQQGCLLHCFDRGYFGAPIQPAVSSTPAKLIFVHSYGLHLCPAEAIEKSDLLVIFSSFSQFHPERPGLKKLSQRMLQQMQVQFERQPQVVWQNFRAKCAQPDGWGDKLTPDPVNFKLLGQDLYQLDTCMLDLRPVRKLPKIVVLHGAEDRIVSAAIGKALAEELAAPYFEIAAAGHALPFTQIATCQAILQPILEELKHEFYAY